MGELGIRGEGTGDNLFGDGESLGDAWADNLVFSDGIGDFSR